MSNVRRGIINSDQSRRPPTLAILLIVLAALAGFWRLDAHVPTPNSTGTDEGKSALLEFRRQEMRRHAGRHDEARRPGDPGRANEVGRAVDPGVLAPAGLEPPPYYPPADPSPPYDAQHYQIELEIFPEDSLAVGKTTITGEVTRDGLDSLVVDYCGAEVFGVELDGQSTTAWRRYGGKIGIELTPPRLFHDDFELVIFHGGTSTRGIYFPQDINPTTLATHTFSEPEDARWWFPCRDVPEDKATLDMIVTVPGDHVVAGNGLLVSSETLLDGRRRFHWREMTPLSTYLMTFQAAPYVVLEDNRLPNIPILNYVYPADSAAAVGTFDVVPEMMTHFETLFGPYPFVKYGHSQANFPGGMEHQTLSMVGEFVVRNGATYEWLLAHELAHQWFGDAVTLADWRHIWLNEGFASYADALWQEHRFGQAGLATRMRLFSDLFKLGYLQNGYAIPVYNPPSEHLFSFAAYDKGAWVLHMLRRITGDEAFFDILRTYQDRHRFGNVVNDDFIAICEELHGSDLNWFFDPWLNDPGLPRYQVDAMTTDLGDGRHAVDVTVRQTQSGAFFPMPVDFALRSQAGESRRTVFVGENPTTFRDTLVAAPIDTVAFLDPDEWILKTVTYTRTVPVTITGLVAESTSDGVARLRWRHEDGARDVLFHVWREMSGGDDRRARPGSSAIRLTDRPLTGRSEYEFVDQEAEPSSTWWVEAREVTGEVSWYGPVRVTATPAPVMPLRLTVATSPAGQAEFDLVVAEPGHLRLSIFDVTGRLVRRLWDAPLTAGRHTIAWDGRDSGGRPLTGVYFARAEASGHSASARVLRRR